MKFSKIVLSSLLVLLFLTNSYSQSTSIKNIDKKDYEFSLHTVLWTFTNFGKPETNTQHYEIQGRYYLTDKDAIGIKVITWKLFAPLGIDLWDDQLLNEESFFPGRLRETGVGVVYQRKLWKGLFATLEVVPLFTKYIDESEIKIANGFKLYNSYHLGYHIPLFKNKRLFIEPQLHVNHWPINTNVPEAFKIVEEKFDNIFLIEPNIYFGIKF